MKKYTCYIIDDEPLAIDVLVSYVKRVPQLELAGTFTDPVDALQMQQSHPADLLFLDIEMPDLSGLEFIRSLPESPDIIITTAYREFAVEGFELRVLDYLVKPIALERFLKAINLFLSNKREDQDNFIVVRADRKQVRLSIDEILYVEGIKDYVKIVTAGNPVLTKESIGNFYPRLPETRFLRVHKSFVVAKDKITAFTHQDIEIGDHQIPIGRVFKESVLNVLEGR